MVTLTHTLVLTTVHTGTKLLGFSLNFNRPQQWGRFFILHLFQLYLFRAK